MEWFERRCRFGRNFRKRNAGSWCDTSNRWAALLRRWILPPRDHEGRILVRSFGCVVQDHRQAHTCFSEGGLRGFRGIVLIGLVDCQMFLEHALSHLIVFSATLQFHVRLDRDFFRQGIVDRSLRSIVALPGPVVYVDACGFPCSAFGMKLLVEFIGVPERVGYLNVESDDLRTREQMKV